MSGDRASPYRGKVLDRTWGSRQRLGRQDLTDLAVAVVIAAVATAETMTGTYGGTSFGTALVLDLAVTLPLAMRRRFPLATFLVILAVIDLRALVLGNLEGAGVFFGLLVGAYSLGAHASLARAIAGMVVFVPAMMVASWLDTGDPFDDVAFIVTLMGGFWLVGRIVWSRNRLLDRLTEQTGELRRSREAEARARAAEQRARIGRDVHDVVAHSVSLMVVQAEAGEAQLDVEHPSAECLRTIQRVGRSTLTELRSVLGTLGDDAAPPTIPGTTDSTPSLRDAYRLAADLDDAGLDIDLRFDGEADSVDDAVSLTAYRILQESLTNALRHAPGATVSAVVHVADDEVVVDVVDTGGGAVSRANGTGRGLAGMRERAAHHGGHVEVGPTKDGFRVRAWLPRAARTGVTQ
jgi:signal transduction histidine kinase